MQLSTLILFVLAGLLFRCETEADETQQESVIGDRLDIPTLLPLVGGDCSSGVASLRGLEYWSWDAVKLEKKTFASDFWGSEESLNSPAISRTFFAYQEVIDVQQQCAEIKDVTSLLQESCVEERSITQKPLDLKICDSSFTYPRPSIESAALSVAGVLDDAYRFAIAAGSRVPLDPLALLVLPDIRFRKDLGNELSITDNAGWVLSEKFSDLGIRNYLVFYPMSASYLASSKPPFWEIPWVINHEYGHHFFYSYLGSRAKQAFGYLKVHEFDRTFHEQHHRLTDASSDGHSNRFFTAINEAVADLFAHYSLGGSSIQMTSISCRFALRDVSERLLNNGLPKRFSSSDFTPNDVDDCEDVNYDNVHTIGAILAYFYDRLLTLSMGDAAARKAERLFSFLEAFAVATESELTRQEALSSNILAQTFIKAALADMESAGYRIADRHCQLIDQTFLDSFDYPARMVTQIPQCR